MISDKMSEEGVVIKILKGGTKRWIWKRKSMILKKKIKD